MEKYGFIYIWRDRKHNRYYIGSHWGTEDDGYICSSNWMRDAYKRRPEDFKRRIILRTSRENLLNEEQKWLDKINPSEIKTRYYNICLSTKKPWWTGNNSTGIKNKIKETHWSKGSNAKEIKEKLRKAGYKGKGKKWSERAKQNAKGSRRKPPIEKQCPQCSSTFLTNRYGYKHDQVYCKRECYFISMKGKTKNE